MGADPGPEYGIAVADAQCAVAYSSPDGPDVCFLVDFFEVQAMSKRVCLPQQIIRECRSTDFFRKSQITFSEIRVNARLQKLGTNLFCAPGIAVRSCSCGEFIQGVLGSGELGLPKHLVLCVGIRSDIF